jgi:hypothetical protein
VVELTLNFPLEEGKSLLGVMDPLSISIAGPQADVDDVAVESLFS